MKTGRLISIFVLMLMLGGLIGVACAEPYNPTATGGPAPTVVILGPGPTVVHTVVPVPAETPLVPIVTSDPPDGYVALAPRVLRSGQTEGISVSLFSGREPAAGLVEISLLNDQKVLSQVSGRITGSGIIDLPVPAVPKGNYQFRLKGPGFQEQTTLKVEPGAILFLETDKPIYKPGQTVMIRALSLSPELKPLPGEVLVEIQDAKGSKVFKSTAATSDFGMATLEMPLSTEPNLGVWKVTAHLGDSEAQVDIRVEQYVLPKYEVTVDLPRNWVLAGEPITGAIGAEYSFGKPVRGEVEIIASRYVGVWEEFATLVLDIDGEKSFELPPVGFVAGVPGAGGQGNVTLDVTVREKGTGYQEETSRIITVASTAVKLQVIPESTVFKPSLPLTLLVVTETPDNQPLDTEVSVNLTYMSQGFDQIKEKQHTVTTKNGKALLTVEPPDDAVALTMEAHTDQAHASFTLEASYSPSGNFIHVEQLSRGRLQVGDHARFHVYATKEAANFYYEVLARGKVIFSQVSQSADIEVPLTPLMAPSARLLVYQILPNNEVAADFVPFDVAGSYPHQVTVGFSSEEVSPGEAVDVVVQTQGPAQVGLVAVDRSVFILAENRLNLQQVFDDLERLYMQPQAELHEARFLTRITTQGARDLFNDAGVVVMSNMKIPEGEEHNSNFDRDGRGIMFFGALRDGVLAVAAPAVLEKESAAQSGAGAGSLAEVQRVRQFFPETWLWTDLITDDQGRASLPVEAPDTITTWVLRAVALSKEHGLGISESELRVFQPFFLQADLPYSAIRGEVLPLKIALYNYLDTSQEIHVELESSGGFELLDDSAKTVTVGPNDVAGVEFRIRLTEIGTLPLKVSARSTEAADAVIKELLVEPEGVFREVVENFVLEAGHNHTLDAAIPFDAVEGSERALVSLTGSYLTQTINGLEGLLRMPFGCGEQNMILFAPNVFVADYLRDTGQLKPEVMAKAEHLMITGYQRELTYQRRDGSFSAFGDSDQEGSLWLTAFVLKTFAQAEDLIYIDEDVLQAASVWILDHQRANGSFEPVGFLHHQELLGGLKGNTALTAYVTIALLESGERAAAARAADYLEGEIDGISDPYTMSIVAYALELAGSTKADEGYDKLMSMAIEDEQGLHWGARPVILDAKPLAPQEMLYSPQAGGSAAIETTGYATLALLERGDRFNASRAAKWLVGQRNAQGGFGSTQDTVVGLQALTQFATDAKFDVDMTVTLSSGSWQRQLRITPENADVLQTIEIPIGGAIEVVAEGTGQVVVQGVRRFNMPEVEPTENQIFKIDVDYGTRSVDVNDLITVSVNVRFMPPEPIEAGMVVLDVSVPTGFAPVMQSIESMVEKQPKVKRHDVAGRKVILYIEDMAPGESLSFRFQALALYPVRAEAVTSEIYSYYKPEWKGESIGGAMEVR